MASVKPSALMAIRTQVRTDNRTSKAALDHRDLKHTDVRHTVHGTRNLLDEQALATMTAAARRSDRGEQRKATTSSDRFSHLLEDDAEDKLEKLLQVVSTPASGGDDVLNFARQQFTDISDLVLALEELLLQYDEAEREEQRIRERKKIADAIASSRALASRKIIQGGINAGVKVRVFSSKAQLSPKVLRDVYRSFLEDSEDGLLLYRNWIAEYGLGRRHALVDFVAAVLISDIHSLDPSCSSIEFNRLLGCTARLRLVRSSDAIIVNMLRDDSLFSSLDDRDACLLKLLFDVLESPFQVETAFLEQLGSVFASLSNDRRALYLQRIKHAFRQLSPDLFINEELHLLVLEKLEHFAALSSERGRPGNSASGVWA